MARDLTINIVRRGDEITIATYDANGSVIRLDYSSHKAGVDKLLKFADEAQPAWQAAVAQAEMAKAEAEALVVKERAAKIAAMLEMGELLWGEGTTTPIPEVPPVPNV